MMPWRVLHTHTIRRQGLVWRDNALIASKDLTVKQNTDPAGEISLHEAFVILLNLGENLPFTDLVQLVLDSLHDLTKNEVLVDKDEEESFK